MTHCGNTGKRITPKKRPSHGADSIGQAVHVISYFLLLISYFSSSSVLIVSSSSYSCISRSSTVIFLSDSSPARR